jgi:hypothetical protein
MMAGIAAQQRELDRATRAIFREPLAHLLHTEILNVQHQLDGLREPLASEARNAARAWLAVADRQWREAQTVLARAPTPQVFRAGDPVDLAQEAFVPRMGVIGEITSLLLLATGCPGLVLYGRRRTGKSTTLRALRHFLPAETRVTVISMQGPQAFTSNEYFATRIAAAADGAWPDRAPPSGDQLGLPDMFVALTGANERLATEGHRLLLALDEYAEIDRHIGEGTLTEDLLAAIRESIQTHRRVIWMFAGSNDIAELTRAPWTSYLVSARTVGVPLFTPEETYALLTEPLRYSPLWPPDDPKRPRYDPALWGEGGIAHIHAEAGGWPHLVQLIAETVIDLLNESTAPHAEPRCWNARSTRQSLPVKMCCVN